MRHPSTGGLCTWENAGYTGGLWFFDPASYGGTNQWFFDQAANDKISALYNKRTNATLISKDYPPSNDQACIPPQAAYNDLKDEEWPQDGTSVNDSISAINLLTVSTC